MYKKVKITWYIRTNVLRYKYNNNMWHVDNNLSVRSMLNKRGIKPENLKPAEDLKKLERRVKTESKKMTSNKLPQGK